MKTEKEIAIALLSHARGLIALNLGPEKQTQALEEVIKQLSQMAKPVYEPLCCPCCGRDPLITCRCFPDEIHAAIERKKSQPT